MSKQSLSKSERIKSRKLVESIFARKQSIFVHPFKLMYLTLEEESSSSLLFGVTVPKRIHKKATKRNRIKRLVREAYRTRKSEFISRLPSDKTYALLFIYIHKEETSVVELQGVMRRMAKKLENEIAKSTHK